MSGGVNLTNAYVTLIPSFEGAQKAITGSLVPSAEAAGDEAGKKSGKRFGSALTSNIAKVLTVGAVVGAAKGLYELGKVFDDVTDTIRVGTGATGEALEGMVQSAKNVGKTVPSEFGDIGTAIADVNTRMGLSGKTLETVASQYLNAGRILGEEVDIGKTSAAFAAFKIEGDNVAGAMDHLFQVSQATGVGMNELATGVKANAPAMEALGFSFEETAVMVGEFDKAGLNSGQVMNSMSKAMVTLAKDGEKPQDAFRRTVDEITGFIEKGEEAAAIELAGKVFGTKGAAQMIQALKDGTLNLEDMSRAAGQTTDTIMGAAKDTESFGEKWQLVKNNALMALEPLGSKVFDAMGSALDQLLPHLDSFGAWLGENTWVIGALAGVIGVTLVAAMIAWTASIWASTAALLANPVTWIVVAIGLLIAALVVLWQNWDEVVAWVTDIWGTFLGWITSGIESFSSWWDSIWTKVKDFLSKSWESMKTKVTDVWNSVFSFLKGVGEKIVNFFLNWTLMGLLIKHWDSIKSKAESAWNNILNFFKGIPDKITGFFRSVGEIVSAPFKKGADLAKDGFNGLVSFVKSIPDKIRSAFSSIASTVQTPFKNAFNGIARAWNNTVGKISFKAPDWVPGMGGKGFSVPKIPMLAEGGTATAAGWSLVGEMGPELLHLPRGASVVPLDHPVRVDGGAPSGGLSRAEADYLADRIINGLTGIARGAGGALDLLNNSSRLVRQG